MTELQRRSALQDEFDTYYATFDNQKDMLLGALQELTDAHPEDSAYMKKSRIHRLLSDRCSVHLFRHTPFYFEISSGRGRHTWGGLQSEVGLFLAESTSDIWRTDYTVGLAKDRKEGFMHGNQNPFNLDHHCPGYDNILRYGLCGIILQARDQMDACEDEKKKEYLRCVISSNISLVGIAMRFAEEAYDLSEAAETEEEKNHYLSIAETAFRTPWAPPETFREALCVILFYREVVSSLEGIGISTFGQLDRMLAPYYHKDLAEGRITRDEAKALIADLLLYTKVRFEADRIFRETSTTIELGGCDSDGNIIYNEVTELILEAAVEVRSINTKLNCRISKNHPEAFLEKIMELQLAALPCVMMHNDDVLIPARVRQGQEIEDARLYAGGGCHEIVLTNTEVCSRAETWINLPCLLLDTLEKKQDAESFEAFYEAVLENIRSYHEKIAALKNDGEVKFARCAPMPLFSSSITGNIERGLDVTEGGAKYNTTMLSMLGTATLIDSLYAVKQLVFEEKKVTLSELSAILDADFASHEPLRQYILNEIPKHGTNDPLLNAFSAKVLSELSSRVSGLTNGRGGRYMPAFYPHDVFRSVGVLTGATPDGRHAFTPLSRGVSPSEFIETDSPLDIIHSLNAIDFTDYADSFITEITLPNLEANEQSKTILISIIRAFLEAGGSSLQFNLLDPSVLKDAKKNPEQHKNLLVRVCGYSAAFVTLHESIQDEIIRRAIR